MIRNHKLEIFANREPFPHIIIDNYLSEEEYINVWNELMFLYPKMVPPEGTGAAKNLETGLMRKRGIGVFLHSVYSQINYSDIGVAISKITRGELQEEIIRRSENLDLIFKMYRKCNSHTILAQLYMNGDYYKPHEDFSLFTSVTLLHKTPRPFNGGELRFPEFDHVIDLQNNQTVIFPGVVSHEVCEVKSLANHPEDGRFTVSQFIGFNNNNREL